MKDKSSSVVHLPPCSSDSPAPFKNRLAEQDNSPMNQTYTIDTSKRTREAEFTIDDAMTGFKPRARSSLSMKLRKARDSSRNRAECPLFSASCKLPRVAANEIRSCTMKPWSRAQIELNKFKEALK